MRKTLGFTRTDGTDCEDFCAEKNTAEFYSSAELKAAGLFMNARTSRALGIIYSYPEIYIIYNVADGIFKWENKVEESFFFRAKQTFLSKLNGIYDSPAKMIFVGKDMGTFDRLLTTEKGSMKNVFNASGSYNDISFPDSSKFAVQQLKCFINKSGRGRDYNGYKQQFFT